MRMLIVTLSAALMLLSIVPQAGAAKSHLKCGGDNLQMRQLGEGVQSEERQMLLPFLRHLSLRPAAASRQTVLVGNDLRIALFWLAGN
jgi:hypothetical protein